MLQLLVPGNGLVGVLLVAITTLGLNEAYAAIISFWWVIDSSRFFTFRKIS